jgi:hypothetical protein
MTSLGLVRAVVGSLVVVALSVGSSTASSQEELHVVRWQEIRGISSPVRLDVNNNVVLNSIDSILPGLSAWSTRSGHATIDLATGHLSFLVYGLVLAGGTGIGSAADDPHVLGRLVCSTLSSPSFVDTPLVSLSPQGDAAFDGNVGPLPVACSDPNIAFLLINPTNGRWIAFGAVRSP